MTQISTIPAADLTVREVHDLLGRGAVLIMMDDGFNYTRVRISDTDAILAAAELGQAHAARRAAVQQWHEDKSSSVDAIVAAEERLVEAWAAYRALGAKP